MKSGETGSKCQTRNTSARYPCPGFTPRLISCSKNSLRSCPIPKRLSIATGYWSGRPTPRLNQDCCSSQGIQSESTTLGSIGDRPFDLQYAHFAARFTVSPAAGTPDVTEAPAPSNSTGWRCSASSVCRRPTSACLIDDRTLLPICSNRVALVLLIHYAEQIQNMLDCSLSQAIWAECLSHFPLSLDFFIRAMHMTFGAR